MTILAVTLIAGCGSGPLDDASLRILSNTKMHGADVTYPDGYEASLTPDEYDLMQTVISALGPINSATEGTLGGYDYRLMYIAGMDPVTIDVKLGGDAELTFQLGAYVYVGGTPDDFRNGVDAIRKQVETNRGQQP